MGTRIGAISATPGSVRLDKSKNDLSVTCSKEGFQTATVAHTSSFSGATFGNILAGGVIGVVVDAASGANFNYPDDIRIEMAASAIPSQLPMASQTPSLTPGAAIRLTPVAAKLESQPALIQPVSAGTVNGVGRTTRYIR